MKVAMSGVTHNRIIDALEFAIDECNLRSLESHSEGDSRSAQAWLLVRAEFTLALHDFKSAPVEFGEKP